jgi:hypothetical protein
MEPAAFIVLLILRSLDTESSAGVPGSLISKLIPLLSKREIKVSCCHTSCDLYSVAYLLLQARQVAAQALANLSNEEDICVYAEDICAAIESDHLRQLNAVHGRVLVLEAFMYKLQLARQAPLALIRFQDRFFKASKLTRWPSVITRGLCDVAASMEDLPTALKHKVAPDLDDANTSVTGILQSLERNLSSQSEVIRSLSSLNLDGSPPQNDIWQRLYQTYVSTTNEPLKNELLPVLGHFGVSVRGCLGDKAHHPSRRPLLLPT